jgi:hypothetical protein
VMVAWAAAFAEAGFFDGAAAFLAEVADFLAWAADFLAVDFLAGGMAISSVD